MKFFLSKIFGIALVLDAMSAFAAGVPVLSSSSSREEIAAWFSTLPENELARDLYFYFAPIDEATYEAYAWNPDIELIERTKVDLERRMRAELQYGPEWLELFRSKWALVGEGFEASIRALQAAMQPAARSTMPFTQEPALESVGGSLKVPKLAAASKSIYRILFSFKFSLQFKPSMPEKYEEIISRLRDEGLNDFADMVVKYYQEWRALEEVLVNFIRAHADVFNRLHSIPNQPINATEFVTFCVDLGGLYDQDMQGTTRILAHLGTVSEESRCLAEEVLEGTEEGELNFNFSVNKESKQW